MDVITFPENLLTTIVFPELKWPPFFANYSLIVILIET